MAIQRRLDVPKQPSTHAGLWLDRFFHERENEDGEAGRHIKQLAGHPVPEGYRAAFDLRKNDFAQRGVICAEAHATGRLIVGLGQKGPIEAGLHLEHTWGVPVLPGTALKGLAATTARQLLQDDAWRKGAASFNELFGTTDDSGEVVFHDAWWVPEDTLPIHLDVMTVHHQKYYASGAVPPSDMDSPNPVAFASVTGRYLVAVEGERPWCDAALSILKIGLVELGIGAKTNAGYGRMRLNFQSDAEKAALVALEEEARRNREQEEQEQREEEMAGVLSRLKPENAADLIKEHMPKHKGPLAQRFAQLAVQKLTPKWLKSKQDKAWVIELLKVAKGDAE